MVPVKQARIWQSHAADQTWGRQNIAKMGWKGGKPNLTQNEKDPNGARRKWEPAKEPEAAILHVRDAGKRWVKNSMLPIVLRSARKEYYFLIEYQSTKQVSQAGNHTSRTEVSLRPQPTFVWNQSTPISFFIWNNKLEMGYGHIVHTFRYCDCYCLKDRCSHM